MNRHVVVITTLAVAFITGGCSNSGVWPGGTYSDARAGFTIAVPESWVLRAYPDEATDTEVMGGPYLRINPLHTFGCSVQVGGQRAHPLSSTQVVGMSARGMVQDPAADGHVQFRDDDETIRYLDGGPPYLFTWVTYESPCDREQLAAIVGSLRRAEPGAQSTDLTFKETDEESEPGLFRGLVHGLFVLPRIVICPLLGWSWFRWDAGLWYWLGVAAGVLWMVGGDSKARG